MSDLVNKVAEILNAPVDLVQRSAKKQGLLLLGFQLMTFLVPGLVAKV